MPRTITCQFSREMCQIEQLFPDSLCPSLWLESGAAQFLYCGSREVTCIFIIVGAKKSISTHIFWLLYVAVMTSPSFAPLFICKQGKCNRPPVMNCKGKHSSNLEHILRPTLKTKTVSICAEIVLPYLK